MKRVILAAVLLWAVLILFTYRATCQDSVYVYATGIRGTITEFQQLRKLSPAQFDTLWLREALLFEGKYYIKSSGFASYEGCANVSFFVYTPAPRNLSAARKQRAFRF